LIDSPGERKTFIVDRFLRGRRHQSRLAVSSLLVGILAVVGCGRSNLHRVAGRVSFADGSPVKAGRVVVEYGDGRSAWGSVKSDGSFTIGTQREGDGMRAGTFRVTVKDAIVPVEKGEPGEFKAIVHKRFADPATSGLEFTVPEKTVWEIVVEKP